MTKKIQVYRPVCCATAAGWILASEGSPEHRGLFSPGNYRPVPNAFRCVSRQNLILAFFISSNNT